MKHTLTKLLGVMLALSTSTSFAGPFRSATFVGSANFEDFKFEVLAGKAVTIVNFASDQPTGKAVLYVTIGGVQAYALTSAPAGVTPTAKDLTIDGPATITIDANPGDKVFLSYRLFAN